MVPMPMLIYAMVMIASRFAFRHRECVIVSEDGARRSSPLCGALLCLLPLGLMQLAPFIEFMLRAKGWLSPELANPRAFPQTASVGLFVFAAGTVLAAVASRQLVAALRQETPELCTGGLYSVIRHPMYAGYLVQGAGCGLMLGALWSWALYGVAVLLIFVRIVAEDRELAGLFPEDAPAYRERVKRLVPFVF